MVCVKQGHPVSCLRHSLMTFLQESHGYTRKQKTLDCCLQEEWKISGEMASTRWARNGTSVVFLADGQTDERSPVKTMAKQPTNVGVSMQETSWM